MSALDIALGHQGKSDERVLATMRQLTPQEVVVAQALVAGRSLPEIAAVAELSLEALTSIIGEIFLKLGVKTLAHMLLLLSDVPAIAPSDELVDIEDLGIAYGPGGAWHQKV